VTASLLAVAVLFSAGTNDPALEARIQSVLPTADEEKWLQIPWRTDLQQARFEAQQSGKPIFLWMMNGHPLGST
jgi:hypothetical protein